MAEYFRAPVGVGDIVWSYSGVRPLYDDGASSATAATRDYVIHLREEAGAAAVDVFGGKITTYRRLSEAVLAKLARGLPGHGRAVDGAGAAAGRRTFRWTAAAALARELAAGFPFLDAAWAARLVRGYGTEAAAMLAGARTAADLGERFGWDLTEREVRWLMEREWALTAEDVLWRRTKLGLRLDAGEAARLEEWMVRARDRTLRARRGLSGPRRYVRRGGFRRGHGH